MGADDEGVAQAFGAECGSEYWLGGVELVPLEGVVAFAGCDVYLLASNRAAGEVQEAVSFIIET